MPTPYQQGAAAAAYEERRGANYCTPNLGNAYDNLQWVLGYLHYCDIAQARIDKKKFELESSPTLDKKLQYEEDGNVLFAVEKPRRQPQWLSPKF